MREINQFMEKYLYNINVQILILIHNNLKKKNEKKNNFPKKIQICI